jgi:hypothetical protein
MHTYTVVRCTSHQSNCISNVCSGSIIHMVYIYSNCAVPSTIESLSSIPLGSEDFNRCIQHVIQAAEMMRNISAALLSLFRKRRQTHKGIIKT